MSVCYRLEGTMDSLALELDLLWQAGCVGVAEDAGEVVAYFDAPVELPLPGRWERVLETDWLARYYADLNPVEVGSLIVTPTHCQVTPRSDQKLLWLDPGMAFGTGHHVTTRLALGALQRVGVSDKTVLDIGAGSGILTIAAHHLGAAHASGIDIDPATVPVATANADLNHARVHFALATPQALPDASADVIVANLTAELHRELALEYSRLLRPHGTLLLTGILEERLWLVLAALGGWSCERVLEDGWALVVANR